MNQRVLCGKRQQTFGGMRESLMKVLRTPFSVLPLSCSLTHFNALLPQRSHPAHSNTSNTVINQDACRNQEEERLFLKALSLWEH